MSNTVFTKYRSNCTNLKANKEVDYYETCGRKHSYSFMVNGRPRVRIVKLNDEPIGRQHAVAIRAYDSQSTYSLGCKMVRSVGGFLQLFIHIYK